MSYTNIFGGYTVNPAFVSYLNLTSAIFNANLTLSWPSQFQDTQNVVASTIDLQPAGANLSIIMPDATQTSTAQYVVFNNYGAHAVTILANDGVTTIISINPGNIFYIYLIDNTTANGTWRVIPFGTGGGGVVTSVAAVSTTTPALTITGSPITSSGTFNFTLDADLVALDSFAAGTGIAARTGVGTWALRSLVAGNGIVLTNPSGVAGNPQIAVNTNLTLTNLTIGNLNLTGNTLSSTAGSINIRPVALANVALGSNVTPIVIDPDDNVTNVNTLTASNLAATTSLVTNYNNSPIARIWIVYDGVNKIVLNSFNLLTANYNGTGDYTFGFNAIPANYLVLTTTDHSGAGAITTASIISYATTSIRVSVLNNTNTAVDVSHVHIAIFY